VWTDEEGEPPRAPQIGGERTYGWGRLGAPRWTPFEGGVEWGGWQWKCGGGELTAAGGRRALAHVDHRRVARAHGTLEALVGRQTQNHRFGRTYSEARIAWAPGSTAEGTFQVGRFGIWERAGGR
jgi:hypothetical protein